MTRVKQGMTAEPFLLTVLITVLPLLVVPTWVNGYEMPKAALVILGSVMITIVGRLSGGWRWQRVFWWGVFWWGWLLVASVVNQVPASFWWWGRVERWQGLVFFGACLLLVLGMARQPYVMARRVLTRAWFISALLTVFFGLWQWLRLSWGHWEPTYAGRIVSSFGQPNFWADYIVVGGVFFGFSLRRWIWRFLGGVIAVLGVVLSGSRLVWALFLPALLTGNLTSAVESRMVIWQAVARALKHHTVFGWGVDRIGEAVGVLPIDGGAVYVDRAHSVWGDMILWGGFGGLILFVGMIMAAGYAAFKQRRWAVVAALGTWILLKTVREVGVVEWVWLFLLVGAAFCEKNWLQSIKLSRCQWGLVMLYELVIGGLLLWSWRAWMY